MSIRNFVASAFAAGALAAAGSASAVVVGGVDFGILGESPANRHIETTTLAETLVTDSGQTLLGYGVINTVNGASTYAGLNKLYFVFEYTSQNFTGTSVEFINGTIDVFLGAEFNLQNQDSLANLAIIQGYSEWARFNGHANSATGSELTANGTLNGDVLSFTGSGLLDVDTSSTFGVDAVAAFLDTNLIGDSLGGFADISINTSGDNEVLNVFDEINGLADGCDDGTAEAGAWCIAGSADLRGDTNNIPEPATLALAGLGILGLGAARRKRAA
ncbi:MAG: PEP-CTERM sorting domain-containing protein [Zoogloeaceae bacterium]|nr:PEP-CTERM sorting domain-containing protein [Rhodocyclaceae bacterium]MCP5234999.1 PEP-CTERM sorting domain-containing protein [Zoogloeaceae bacterium]